MRRSGPPRRGLLLECCPYHEELIPSWRQMVEDLGHRLDVATVDGPAQRQILATLNSQDLRVYRVDRLDQVPFSDYDFLLLGSLVHAGFGLDTPLLAERFGFGPEVPLPDLDLLKRLGLPSLAVVHEPTTWLERLPTELFEFKVHEPNAEHGFLRLFPDGEWYCDSLLDDGDLWVHRYGPFSISGETPERILLTEGETTRVFASEGGGIYHTSDGTARLRRLPYRRPELANHLLDDRHAVVTLSRPGRNYLRRSFPGVEQLLPFNILEDSAIDGSLAAESATAESETDVSPAHEYVFAAAIDHRRKNLKLLIDAVMATDQEIVMVGGTREEDFDANPWVQKFKQQIAEAGLKHRFHFTGHLDHRKFLQRVQSARFLIPLIDDRVDGGAYRTKLPAVILWSLAFSVPMILEETLARRFDLEMMVTYPGDDLASGLAAAREMSDGAYADLRRAIAVRAQQERQRNRGTLKALLDRILAPGLGGPAA